MRREGGERASLSPAPGGGDEPGDITRFPGPARRAARFSPWDWPIEGAPAPLSVPTSCPLPVSSSLEAGRGLSPVGPWNQDWPVKSGAGLPPGGRWPKFPCIFGMAAKFRRLNFLAEHVMKARRMLKAKCRVKEGRRLSGRRRSCTF